MKLKLLVLLMCILLLSCTVPTYVINETIIIENRSCNCKRPEWKMNAVNVTVYDWEYYFYCWNKTYEFEIFLNYSGNVSRIFIEDECGTVILYDQN